MITRRLVSSSSSTTLVINKNTTAANTCLHLLLVSSPIRSYFGHDVSKGVKGESDRGGPQRVPSMRADRTIFDPTLRSPDEIREEFDRENEQIELENAKMRAAYTNSHNAHAALHGLNQRINNTQDASGRLGERKEDEEIDLEESIRNATPSKGQYTFVDPDEKINPHRGSQTGFGAFDDRTTASQESFLSGNIHDRESIRVRGQKPPPDLPLTDDEVWKHPTAKNMRVAGIFMMFFVLDIMWNLTTDPFNEGERYVRFAMRQDGSSKFDSVPYLTAKDGKAAADKQVQQGIALRDSMLPWRQ